MGVGQVHQCGMMPTATNTAQVAGASGGGPDQAPPSKDSTTLVAGAAGGGAVDAAAGVADLAGLQAALASLAELIAQLVAVLSGNGAAGGGPVQVPIQGDPNQVGGEDGGPINVGGGPSQADLQAEVAAIAAANGVNLHIPNGAAPIKGDPTQVDSPTQEPMQYTVKGGDTLSNIASAHGTTWQEIYDANKDVIGENPNLIHPGQTLQIPSPGQTPPPTTQTPPPSTQTPPSDPGPPAGGPNNPPPPPPSDGANGAPSTESLPANPRADRIAQVTTQVTELTAERESAIALRSELVRERIDAIKTIKLLGNTSSSVTQAYERRIAEISPQIEPLTNKIKYLYGKIQEAEAELRGLET